MTESHSPAARVVILTTGPLDGPHEQVRGALSPLGASCEDLRVLSDGVDGVSAGEIGCTGASLTELRDAVDALDLGSGTDVAVVPETVAAPGRRLLIMDVDSTLIRDEVIELLADHAGKRAEVAAVTERAMRGELDFTQSLHARVATLAGLPATVLDETRARVRVTPGARTLVRTLKSLGDTVAVVSGGFIEVVQPLADDLGIDHARANRLEVVDGTLTGRVLGDVVDRTVKEASLREFAAADGLSMDRTVAVGDGANDLDMLGAAGLGVAFNAKPIVQEQASAAINTPRLDSVLYYLGLRRDEFVAAHD
ncbi:phosphoserine phosphatase SerB [Kribbia dieselivorans]|uniref:phosphoserine phosphatase SerB n=1 Tax=Kribbia dieselivorans TaxID=331526 RepID=UPI000837D0DF|nr:phosphoserine phosphatase SerB [Kribbia dieselivorans]